MIRVIMSGGGFVVDYSARRHLKVISLAQSVELSGRKVLA